MNNIQEIDDLINKNENKERPVLLVASGLKKNYADGESESRALKGIDLTVYDGDFIVILGKSGCGKTTLLNLLGGIDKATSGSLIYGDIDLCKVTEKERILYRRNRVGFIFQNYHLMPNLNVTKNIQLIAELVKEPLEAEAVLRSVGLEDKKESYPCQLSGGQQQRVAIARALVKNPQIIVADEPTAALDYQTSLEVLSVLEEIHRKGTTIIMVTHNEQIARMAERQVIMRDGRIEKIIENDQCAAAKELEW